ncbi:MAG: TRAM domain-containing protein [Acidiferrobacterales bacterium]|nr:TRAM domain-containing protein [Acidiferrobacterales bacterium]
MRRFMEAQSRISAGILRAKVGRQIRVLVDEVNANGVIARSSTDAPEIDGKVFVDDGTDLKPGEFAEVVIARAGEYDLHTRRVH